MRKRDILFIFSGVILTILVVRLYNMLKPESVYYYSDNIRLVDFNDEILNQRANAIVLASQKISPSVVSITVIQTKIVSTSPFFSPFADEFFRDFFKDYAPEYYTRKKIKNLGSGVIISPDGYILTNEHVIANAIDINITLPDGRQFRGKIIASDQPHDLALLKIDVRDLPYAELGTSDDLMIGEWVIALGNPFGFLLEDTRPTVTVGVISALNRSIKSTRDSRIYKNMIQTDAAINPGNSGGPLVNILGQVIGINTAIFSSSGGSEGIGFAQSIDNVKKFIKEAKEFGKVRTPWIGLWVQDITQEIAESMGIGISGVLVNNIDIGSSAQGAGIKEGDRIVSVNNRAINSVSDWDRFVSNVFVDDILNITLFRKKKSIETSFIVKEFKQSAGTEKSIGIYGIYVENIDSRLKKQYNLGYNEGVVVIKVEPNKIGRKLGLKPGDVVLQIGNMRIRTKNDFQRAFKASKNINVIIDRNGMIVQLYLGL